MAIFNKMSVTPQIIMVTASSLEEARKLAQAVLQPHLAACVNIIPGIESHYWWQGKLEQSTEVLLLIKSSVERFEALAQVICENHSYECPEIVALSPEEMAPAYRAWWENELQTPDASRRA